MSTRSSIFCSDICHIYTECSTGDVCISIRTEVNMKYEDPIISKDDAKEIINSLQFYLESKDDE